MSTSNPMWFAVIGLSALVMWIIAFSRVSTGGSYFVEPILLTAVAFGLFVRWRNEAGKRVH